MLVFFLPTELLNSSSYNGILELRGPMEEIILAYETERARQGLTKLNLSGNGWSRTFRKRFEGIYNQPTGPYEKHVEEMLDK